MIKKFFITLFIIGMFLSAEKAFSQGAFNVYDNPGQYMGPETLHQENILIILDCSLSMEDEIHGQPKIDIAREVISKVLSQMPGNIPVGLRVYGHKRSLSKSFLSFDQCEVSELVVPVGVNNRRRIFQELSKLRAVGMTPICYSIDQSVHHDFEGMPGEKRIILVSDGMETCNGSPCDFAVELIKNGVDVKIDVIGFDLSSNPDAQKHLKCAALVTNGRYYSANSPEQFLKSLQDSFSVSREVQGKIFIK